MYLSRVEIDLNNRRQLRDVSHLGAYHHSVESGFPQEQARGIRTRKLWRLDNLNGHCYLLIVSETAPDVGALERYGVPGSAQTKSYDAFLERLQPGMSARFRVTLNPVEALANRAEGRGRIVPLLAIEKQEAFLLKRAQSNGFILNPGDFTIVERGSLLLRKQNQPRIRLNKAVYEGVLTIGDADLFRRALTQGIGKQKAYGFGMMTVIPQG